MDPSKIPSFQAAGLDPRLSFLKKGHREDRGHRVNKASVIPAVIYMDENPGKIETKIYNTLKRRKNYIPLPIVFKKNSYKVIEHYQAIKDFNKNRMKKAGKISALVNLSGSQSPK